ncbi:TPA: hypothetical protein NKV98_004413 [Vibrio parahaemolyticus]|uniref:hypothetical protein n=1 Tax=Vibrio TaxID=662 RepID=UPI000933C8CB|nr:MULTISPECIES: hypothetical protein [Vibrio]EGQ8195812.1 hypothetical protein [Vibrio parahaemolyticus]EHE7897963.1 hypothetical protein [Vibrio parahaemolyticus]MCS0263404.1 hypothetical protein [Vibrio alginolyticus]MDF4280520.1 hypothetical protein [Vibrio parahaemolyticus]MDG2550244.1 hypothetical protein [Vibrio parahaemolyticus]
MSLSLTDERILTLFESGAVRSKVAAVSHYRPELSRDGQQRYATDLWKKKEVIERNAFVAEATAQEAEAVQAGLRYQWRAITEGIETLLVEAGICEIVQVPDKRRTVFDMRTVLKPGVALPQQALPFIKRIELVNAFATEDALEQRRAIVAHEYGNKEKLRASELLAKSYGQLIERQELTGGNGGPIEQVTADMSATDAANIYKNAVRGNSQPKRG